MSFGMQQSVLTSYSNCRVTGWVFDIMVCFCIILECAATARLWPAHVIVAPRLQLRLPRICRGLGQLFAQPARRAVVALRQQPNHRRTHFARKLVQHPVRGLAWQQLELLLLFQPRHCAGIKRLRASHRRWSTLVASVPLSLSLPLPQPTPSWFGTSQCGREGAGKGGATRHC